MTNTVTPQGIVSGMWKFHERITKEELIQLAEEWRDGRDGHRYLHLCVRKCSKDQRGIWFVYLFGDIVDSHEPFFHKMTDQLKRRFGNDFVGWDVSSPTWVVKSDNFGPTQEKYPPISPETLVMTTNEMVDPAREWPEEMRGIRRWGVKGKVLRHHDRYGFCYEVQHEDGTISCYDPSELEVLD